MKTVYQKLAELKISYNYCGICGSQPKTDMEEPNYAPIKYWDCDDGWRIGTLCRYCFQDVHNQKPQESDYAYQKINDYPDINTDEDEILAL